MPAVQNCFPATLCPLRPYSVVPSHHHPAPPQAMLRCPHPLQSLNMAALYKLPHIFVVENNLWAIGMSHLRATASTSGDHEPQIWKKASGLMAGC